VRLIDRYPALAAPLYRRYWLASLASVGGWQISAIAMGWLVFELSGSTLDLGILGAATAVPAIALTLAGGVIADRFDKRVVLVWTSGLSAVALFVLASLDAGGAVSVWHVWLIAACISLVSGVDWPTRQSFFVHLIDREGLLSAVALNSVLWQVTRMVLPGIGGLMIDAYGSAPVFALAGLGYLIMMVVIWRFDLELPGSRDESPWQQTMAGVRFILDRALFRNLILLSYCTMLFMSSYMHLMPAFAKLLESGGTGFGLLMSATGLGSVLGTLIVGAMNPGRAYGRVMLAAAFVGAIMLYAFAVSTLLPSFVLALIFAMLTATGTSVFLILSTTALQAQVPDALRGRVMGVHGITYSLMPLGALLTGALATQTGTPFALMWLLTIYVAILLWLTAREAALRELIAPHR